MLRMGLMGVGPRQVIDFMSQGWEKRADLGLRVPIWGFKLH
jgi:hypothetical protein